MKKSVSAWEERVAKERPKARSQPKYSWQVPVPTVDEKEDFQSTSTTDNFNFSDGLNDQNENDQVDQNDDHIDLSSTNNTTVNIVTNTKKVPVTSAEKEPVTNTKKVPVQKIETSTKKVTDTEKVPVATFRIPHQELDYLFKELDTSEFKLYLRLYRLSHGWGQEICRVGDNNLMETLNMSKNSIRGAKQGLISKKLLEIIQIVNLGPKGYTEYRVIRTGEMLGQPNSNWYQKGTSSKKVTDTKKVPNKEDHDDDYLNKDHHQNKLVPITEHQQQVMMMYQKITDNAWTKADSDTYTKVKAIPIEKIEIALRLASERAKNRPNSFAFFIKEILSVSSPKKQSHSQQKKAMEKIMVDIRNSKVGSSNYTISDFAYDVKEACIMEDVAFDNNIFDEICSKQRSL